MIRGAALQHPFVGVALTSFASLPPVRAALESWMNTQMLVQFPALLVAGALIADGLPRRWVRAATRWNAHVLAGLVFAAPR